MIKLGLGLLWATHILAQAQKGKLMKEDALTIIHTNDLHSHYDQFNKDGDDCTQTDIDKKQCYGGIARMQTKIQELRNKYKKSLLFDAGDQFQDTMFYLYSKGNITWKAMNLLKYDLMTVGNHEFDNGPENLARVASHFNFPLVSSNIDASQHPTLGKIIKRYRLYPDFKLAVIGYITYKTPSIANIGDKIKIIDPVVAVQSAIDDLNEMGYKRVVAVSHNGYKQDIELARKVKGLSLIVGGHSHTYLAPSSGPSKDAPTSDGLYPTPVTNKDNQTTYIVQSYYMGRFLGHLDIKFANDGYLSTIEGKPIELNSEVAKDSIVQKEVEKWRKPIDAYGKIVLGQSTGEFDRWGCHKNECELGNFITDIMLNYCPQADMVIMNSGDIRKKLPKGPITVENVAVALPYGSTIVQISQTGKQIWDIIESVLSRNSTSNHQPVTSFIQISGLKFNYNPDAGIFHKLTSVSVYDKTSKKYLDLRLNKKYRLVTSNFIAKGGNNIISPPISNFKTLDAIDKITMDYIKSHSPVSPPALGRIIKSQ